MTKQRFGFYSLFFAAALFSGCLSQTQYSDEELQKTQQNKAQLETVLLRAQADCLAPWGEIVPTGQAIQAFSAQTVCEEACSAKSMVRKCENGALTGDPSFQYKTCQTGICSGCKLPWGGLAAHNEAVPAFSKDEVGCGNSCSSVSTTRQCKNGVLLGDSSYSLGSCKVLPCPCALPWRPSDKIPSGSSVEAFKAPSVLCEQKCESAQIRCENGSLAGAETYSFETCSVGACASCSWSVNGNLQSVPHLGTVQGYYNPKVGPAESCTSKTLTCKNGAFDDTTYPHSECKKQCALNWTDHLGSTHTESYDPGQTIILFSQNKTACQQGNASISVAALCDPAGSGQLKAQNGGTLPSALYAQAPEVCTDCTIPDGPLKGQTLKDGENTPEYFSLTAGNCSNRCENNRGRFLCQGGQLYLNGATLATNTDLIAFKNTSCLNDCVECKIDLADKTQLVLSENGSQTLSSTDKVTNCEESCKMMEATVTCKRVPGTSNGALTIVARENEALRVSDLKYTACTKPESLRCDSGGNPTRACALPLMPMLDRNEEWHDSAIYKGHRSGEHWGGNNAFFQEHYLGTNHTDPRFRAGPLITYEQYGKKNLYAPRYMKSTSDLSGQFSSPWPYQVSPDTTFTFYDTPVVDQRTHPGDHCDLHALTKRCTPDGYWARLDETFRRKGGVGPKFEEAPSQAFFFPGCRTIPASEPKWSNQRSISPQCLTQSGAGGCIFDKNPFHSNGRRPVLTGSENPQIDSLQKLSIPAKINDLLLGQFEGIRIIDHPAARTNACRYWSCPLPKAKKILCRRRPAGDSTPCLTDEEFQQRKTFSSIITDYRPGLEPETLNGYSNALTLTEVPEAITFNSTTPKIPYSLNNGTYLAPYAPTPLDSMFINEFGQPLFMVRTMSSKPHHRPALKANTLFTLIDFQERLTERLGAPWVYFAHQYLDVELGSGAYQNNAAYMPRTSYYGTNPTLFFGPITTIANSNTDIDSNGQDDLTLKFGDPYSIDGSIVAHELGHFNLSLALTGGTSVQSPNGTCATNLGCLGAINEGQADYFAAMLYPEAPALGDGITETEDGISTCGLSRNVQRNKTVTSAQAYSACSTPGEVHAMGAVYASIWWELRSSQTTETKKTEVDRLMMEHLKYLTLNTDFYSSYRAVWGADRALFGTTGKYAETFRTLLNQRLPSSSQVPSNTPAFDSFTIPVLADLTLSKKSKDVAVRFAPTGVTNPTALSFTASSSNQAVLSNSSFKFSGTGVNRTLAFTPTEQATGEVTITITGTLGNATATQSFKVRVTEDAEALTSDQTRPLSIDENVAFGGIPITTLLGPHSSFTLLSAGKHGILRGSPPTYYPELGFVGDDSLVFEVNYNGTTRRVTLTLQIGIEKEVRTVDEFLAITENPFAKISVKENLDFTGRKFEQLFSETNPFYGQLDGNNHALQNIQHESFGVDYSGFFGFLRGRVQNLSIKGLDSVSTGNFHGGFAAKIEATGRVTNLQVAGSLRGGWTQGGITAYLLGQINRAQFSGTLSPLFFESKDSNQTPRLQLFAQDIDRIRATGIVGYNQQKHVLSKNENATDELGNPLPYEKYIYLNRPLVQIRDSQVTKEIKVSHLAVPSPSLINTYSQVYSLPVGVDLPFSQVYASHNTCANQACEDITRFLVENTCSEEPYLRTGIQTKSEPVFDEAISIFNAQKLTSEVPLFSDRNQMFAQEQNLTSAGITGAAFLGAAIGNTVSNTKISITAPATTCDGEPVLGIGALLLPARSSDVDHSTLRCQILSSNTLSLKTQCGITASPMPRPTAPSSCTDGDESFAAPLVPSPVPTPSSDLTKEPFAVNEASGSLTVDARANRSTQTGLTTQSVLIRVNSGPHPGLYRVYIGTLSAASTPELKYLPELGVTEVQCSSGP